MNMQSRYGSREWYQIKDYTWTIVEKSPVFDGDDMDKTRPEKALQELLETLVVLELTPYVSR